MMPDEKLVMFDLDGTVIDDTYSLTSSNMSRAVDSAIKRGWKIGLSSDTPYEGLRQWRRSLGMNGPIIAERGAVVELESRLDFDTQVADEISRSRAAIGEHLSRQAGTLVLEGSAMDVKAMAGTDLPAHRRIIIMNKLSRCSLRFFVRSTDENGSVQIDDDTTQATISELERFYPDMKDAFIDNNPRFGLFIMAERGISKRKGLETLLNGVVLSRCVMVGNSLADFVGNDLAEQYAVANADEDYKKLVVVAKQELTEGCIEILDNLDKS